MCETSGDNSLCNGQLAVLCSQWSTWVHPLYFHCPCSMSSLFGHEWSSSYMLGCISIWTTHYFSVTGINKTSSWSCKPCVMSPVIGLKMSEESSTVTLQEDFADFQPYLPLLVIRMSCLLCPQHLAMFCVFLQPAVSAYWTSASHWHIVFWRQGMAEDLQGEFGWGHFLISFRTRRAPSSLATLKGLKCEWFNCFIWTGLTVTQFRLLVLKTVLFLNFYSVLIWHKRQYSVYCLVTPGCSKAKLLWLLWCLTTWRLLVELDWWTAVAGGLTGNMLALAYHNCPPGRKGKVRIHQRLQDSSSGNQEFL